LGEVYGSDLGVSMTLPDVLYGSGADIRRPRFYVRYTPDNGHEIVDVRFRGNNGHSRSPPLTSGVSQNLPFRKS
jgi:hypothetical protein